MAGKISPKVQELRKKVYNTMLALADPKTGTMQITLLDLCAVAGVPERKRDAEYAVKLLQREGRVVIISRHGMAGVVYRLPELVKGDTVTTYQQRWAKKAEEVQVTPLPAPKPQPEKEPVVIPEAVPVPDKEPVPDDEAVMLALESLEQAIEEDADILNVLLKSYYRIRKRSQALIKAVKEQ